jgi:predicted dehydrogenase
MSSSPTSIGLIGCGKISTAYINGSRAYPGLRIAGCADLDAELARRTATEQGIPFGGAVEELLARPEIDIVVNLTIPAAHADVNRRILAAGKHVYCEKPFALSAADTARVVSDATQRGLRVASAPDTFLGSGIQTARRLIDEGVIGRPVAAVGFMMCRGHETWHPNPAFYYQPGGGPMWDMGPYYLTALVSLLGPIAQVSGLAQRSFEQRTITSEPRRGQVIPVEVATHYSTSLAFASGATGTLVMSFDTQPYPLPNLVIYGSEGTLRVPDPNHFDGIVQLARLGEKEFVDVPNLHPIGRARGSGVADLAAALRSGRPHRANGELAHHVVDAMEAADRSAREQRHVALESTCERPAAVPASLPATEFD